jgi:hypothetical protein
MVYRRPAWSSKAIIGWVSQSLDPTYVFTEPPKGGFVTLAANLFAGRFPAIMRFMLDKPLRIYFKITRNI